MRLAFVFHRGRKARLELVGKQQAPTEFFLGAVELQRRGVEVGVYEIDLEGPTNIFGGVGNWLAARGCLPEKLTGSALAAVRPWLGEFNAYDCVLATTSGIGFALSAWKRGGRLRRPLVVVHCGLLNNSYGRLKKYLTNFLLAGSEIILYGEGELAPLISLFPSAAARTHVCQFGVDTEFWSPADDSAGSFVLSIGNDGRRDFETTLEVARRLPDIPFRLITSRPMEGTLPANVELIKGDWHSALISDMDLRSIYRKALCVLVLLKESFQPSGQSVTLQAWACGCPVILTRTSGLWSPDLLRDGEKLLLVEPNRPDMAADAVRRLAGDRDLRRRMFIACRAAVCLEGNIETFATSLAKVCEKEIAFALA